MSFEVIKITGKQIEFKHEGKTYKGKLWASCDERAPYGKHEIYSGIVEITLDGIEQKNGPNFTWEERQRIGKLCRKFNPEEVKECNAKNAKLGHKIEAEDL